MRSRIAQIGRRFPVGWWFTGTACEPSMSLPLQAGASLDGWFCLGFALNPVRRRLSSEALPNTQVFTISDLWVERGAGRHLSEGEYLEDRFPLKGLPVR